MSMPEQLPKFICEMCGGAHPTSEHKGTTKTTKVPEKLLPLEAELSPEIAEKVMERVIDIDTPGVAYSALAFQKTNRLSDRLMGIFNAGLLGSVDRSAKNSEAIKEAWARGVRRSTYIVHYEKYSAIFESKEFATRKEAEEFVEKEGGRIETKPSGLLVFFNIVGRVADKLDPLKTQISQTTFANAPDSVTFLFDLSSFKEKPGIEGTRMPLTSLGTYRPAMLSGSYKYKGIGKIKPKSLYGFVLSARVRPKRFQGIVIAGPLKKGSRFVEADDSIETLQSRATQIANVMKRAYKDRPEMLLPIYDLNGNLLWPRQMNYEDVEKLVGKRTK